MLRKQLHGGSDASTSRQRTEEQASRLANTSAEANTVSDSEEDDSEEPSLLGRLHQSQSTRKTPKMDLIATQGSPRFVKRSVHANEQSRYDAVGYPKSTRVSHGSTLRKQQSAATLRSAPTSYHQSPLLPSSSPQVAAMPAVAEPHSRLKGFETRVINTHCGKAVVRAPILIESTATSGSRKGHRDEVPVLPPPSAAELRYNAQRALISTTAVLRSAVNSKTAASAGRPHVTIGVKVGSTSGRRARRITRTMSDQIHGMHSLPPTAKEGATQPSGGFQISMQFSSEDESQLRQRSLQQKQGGSGYAGLEQGRASSSSMLELWGISTMRGADGAERGSDEGDGCNESVAESGDTRQRAMQTTSGEGPALATSVQSPKSTTMTRRLSTGFAGPDDKRGSQVVLSDESQKLIESIFSGRLSIGTNSDKRSSREEHFKKSGGDDDRMSNKRSPLPAPKAPVVAGDSHSAAVPERDGTKMRKPSFWSMFRGANGSQRREPASDEKASCKTKQKKKVVVRDSSTVESSPVTQASFTTVSGRQHFLKKQQSSSSGFAESFGLSKLLTLGDSRYGTASTSKALPQAPLPSPPLPPLPPPTPLISSALSAQQAAAVPAEQTASEETASPKPAMAPPPLVDNADSARLSGSFYTPMQEFFGVSASGDPVASGSVGATPETKAKAVDEAPAAPPPPPPLPPQPPVSGTVDLVQGADSQSGLTPAESPETPQCSRLEVGGSEPANGTADENEDDTDSDIVPLSQSRALASARLRSDSAGPDVAGSSGLGIVDSSASVSSAATRSQALNIPYNMAAAAELEGTLLSAGRLRFSPDAPARMLEQTSGADNDNDTEIDIDLDDDDDDDDDRVSLADENSQQACAMGKYLYDVEEFRCQAAERTAVGSEPPVPRMLQGIAVPALADHAEWLGKREVFNGLALRYYIGNYDFCGLRIDESLRRLCSHIFLRGESQVIDRLLVALAQRFVECNPDTKLRSADVAHAVTYSTLLLNTDLHIADIRASDRMTKSRFVRNTIDTVAQFQSSSVVVADGVVPQLPELDLTKQSMESEEPLALRGLVGSMASLQVAPYGSAVSRTSRDVVRLMGARGKRFSFFETSSSPGPSSAVPPGLGVAGGAVSSPSSLRAFDRLRRKVSTTGTSHARTLSMDEVVETAAVGDMPNLAELSLVLKDVYAGIKAKPLGQPLFARQHAVALDARPSSVRSMPMHSAQRTRSINSMNQALPRSSTRPPHHPDLRLGDAVKRAGSSMLNFGNNNVMGPNGVRASPSSASMGYSVPHTPAYSALLRSPIENQHIRSGVLVRKHLFERAGKKASHRAWRTCYVSVDRGTVAMYKMDGRHGAHPDGRELTDTSLQLGSVSLRHTMTHMLPSPGYSRSRPHVFALQLPSGGVYLFQTASEVELRDWVAACNYWAARESKAPYMIGGVYNMEYGWDNTGDFTLRFDEREAREDRGEELSPAEQVAEDRRILEERDASKGSTILEWTPPNNPMQRSDLDEAAQLKSLLHHITYLEEELVSHKKVQGSIEERFYPKTHQFHRGFSNWERKAQYILQELIKYQSYADVLQKALKQMQDEIQSIPEESPIHPPPPDVDTSAMRASCSTPMSATAGGGGFSTSRASLPQAPLTGRRTLDLNGNPTPSKSLPIKELLAPASEKARNRASIIVTPNSVSSSSNTVNSAVDNKRRVSGADHGSSSSPRSSTAVVPIIAEN
ncbi:hypothetical protein GGI20_004926 [Coemansia sp. BCRC 34301]|nr:hypothetical protein GGI20_004926 [Coemansia sp. BCRC 34301]